MHIHLNLLFRLRCRLGESPVQIFLSSPDQVMELFLAIKRTSPRWRNTLAGDAKDKSWMDSDTLS